MSVASSTLSSPTTPGLAPMEDKDALLPPISAPRLASTENRRTRRMTASSDIISISSDDDDEELMDDDDDATEDEASIPFTLYTQGNGVLYVNDMSTGSPTNRVVGDLAFENRAKAQSINRFYVVTIGSDVGIFDNVYVFHFVLFIYLF